MERGFGTKSPALSPDIMVSVPLRITDQISSKNTSVRATEVCYVNSYGDFPPQDKGVGGWEVEKPARENTADSQRRSYSRSQFLSRICMR